MNPITEALKNLQEKKFDLMKENINTALVKKAAVKLEEMKVDLASAYFDRK
jgi:hypothetical protein